MIPFERFIEELNKEYPPYIENDNFYGVNGYVTKTKDMACFYFNTRKFIVSYSDNPRFMYVEEMDGFHNFKAIPIGYDGEEGLKQIVKEFLRYRSRG